MIPSTHTHAYHIQAHTQSCARRDREAVRNTHAQHTHTHTHTHTPTWMPLPLVGMNASTVVVKSPPANFSFSLLRPLTTGTAINSSYTRAYRSRMVNTCTNRSKAHTHTHTHTHTCSQTLGKSTLNVCSTLNWPNGMHANLVQ